MADQQHGAFVTNRLLPAEFVGAPQPWPDSAHACPKRTGAFQLLIYIRTGIVHE